MLKDSRPRQKNIPQKKQKRRSRSIPLALVIVFLSSGTVFLYQYLHDTAMDEQFVPQNSNTVADSVAPDPSRSDRQQQINLNQATSGQEGLGSNGQNIPFQYEDAKPDQAELSSISNSASSAPAGSQAPDDSVTAIESFYAHLDQQPYLTEITQGTQSKVYFSRLIQKMLDTPPVVSGETSDLFTLLQNTAHFFRIVGRENVMMIKTIIAHEKNSYEQILAEFYTLSQHPDDLLNTFSINVRGDALYDYAGFFLTTMGGRMYLFRRDSALRLIVSYYSVLVVNEAIQAGHNRHGVDLRPVIDNLIQEMEASGAQLRMKETYLDKLYDLKVKYQ